MESISYGKKLLREEARLDDAARSVFIKAAWIAPDTLAIRPSS
jgi:hypothetical protein